MAEPKLREQLIPIGKRARKAREEAGLTQEELATAAKLSKSFISEVEAGRTAASGLHYLQIANALGVRVQWLLTGESLPGQPESRPSVLPEVALVADQEGWSYQLALDISEMVRAVHARRTTSGRAHELTRDEILQLGEVIGGNSREPDETN